MDGDTVMSSPSLSGLDGFVSLSRDVSLVKSNPFYMKPSERLCKSIITLADLIGTIWWISMDLTWFHVWPMPTVIVSTVAALCMLISAVCTDDRVVRLGYLMCVTWILADFKWALQDPFKMALWGMWVPDMFFALSGALFFLGIVLAGENRDALVGVFGRVRRKRPNTIPRLALGPQSEFQLDAVPSPMSSVHHSRNHMQHSSGNASSAPQSLNMSTASNDGAEFSESGGPATGLGAAMSNGSDQSTHGNNHPHNHSAHSNGTNGGGAGALLVSTPMDPQALYNQVLDMSSHSPSLEHAPMIPDPDVLEHAVLEENDMYVAPNRWWETLSWVLVILDMVSNLSWLVMDFCWYHKFQKLSITFGVISLLSAIGSVISSKEFYLKLVSLSVAFWVLADVVWMMQDFGHMPFLQTYFFDITIAVAISFFVFSAYLNNDNKEALLDIWHIVCSRD